MIARTERRAWIVALVLVGCGAKPTSPAPAAPPRVSNLHAFARLYGVVRWFHPSDAAATIDWDRFAIDGARRVIDAPDARALRVALDELFAPLAPTVHLAAAGEAFPDEPALHPPDGPSDVVAWEHAGYGDSVAVSVYGSKRRDRPRMVADEGVPYGALWQAVDATPYRGLRLRLRGKVRTRSPAHAQLWVRVERGDAPGFSDRMNDRPISGPSWQPAEILGLVDQDATRILFGPLASGVGAAWFDDLELSVQAADGRWSPVAIHDAGFEAADSMASWNPGIAKGSQTTTKGWIVRPDRDRPASGLSALRIEAATHPSDDELFADAPGPGETVELELGGGLRARVPIALYSKDGHTIGDDPAAARRSQAAPALAPAPGFDAIAGVADVIVTWNAVQHFWPYWDVVQVDAIAELDAALRDALDDRTIDDHIVTLRRLGAATPDDHVRVSCPGRERRVKPPFAVDVIEAQVVVTASADPAIQRGDIVVALDGQPAAAQLAALAALASGTPQWRRVRARGEFGDGTDGSTLRVRVRRHGAEHDVRVTRRDATLEAIAHPAIERLADGVYYVNLAEISAAQLDAALAQLAGAPAIVFDVRARPVIAEPVLGHLLTRHDDAKWLVIPHIIRPDHGPRSITSWQSIGWDLAPLEPHFAGRVAFLTGPDVASFGESLMGLVAHYQLGAIVGSATAGTNGNIAQIAEPSGCFSVFTGMKVTRGDGSRFHLLGVQPTIPAAPTIAGVAAGRDEVLERALAYVRAPAM